MGRGIGFGSPGAGLPNTPPTAMHGHGQPRQQAVSPAMPPHMRGHPQQQQSPTAPPAPPPRGLHEKASSVESRIARLFNLKKQARGGCVCAEAVGIF